MKKSLLCCLTVAAGVTSAFAAEPTLYEGYSFNQISANGRYAVSEVYGTLTVYDLTTGDFKSYGPDEENWGEYSIGLGNCMTTDGSIILASTPESYASYLKDGVWYALVVPDEEMVNLSNGITPDGSRICGSVGLSAMTLEDDVIMQVPAYWDRKGEGYGEYHVLPYPTKDFFGETPQYVTAVAISSDGKTIIGQMTFGSGRMNVPVVYTEDADGKWSYSLPSKALFNPNNIEAVEYPGECPLYPDPADFMSGERKDAYQEAWDNWEWPDAEDYMTAEEKAAFDEAKAKADEEIAVWEEKFSIYQEYQMTVMEESPNFVFNNVLISTDNKYMVSSLVKEVPNDDPLSWSRTKSIYTPCSLNLATGELEVVDTELSLLASGVANDGVILASNGTRSIPMLGYIIKGGEVQAIDDYISSINPSYGEWIKENMTHEVITGYEVDEETEEYYEIIEEVTYTGLPIATPDLSVISIWNNRSWDYDSEYQAESVVFDMTKTTGISVVAAGNKDLSVVNGALVVPAGFATVEIFNVNGACVKTVSGVEGTVKLNLGNGAYIAKGTRADGSVSVIKFAK